MGPEQKLVFLHCIIHPKVWKSVQKVNHVSFSVDVTGLMNQLKCRSLFVLEMYSLDHLHRFSSILDTLHGEFTRQFQDILYTTIS